MIDCSGLTAIVADRADHGLPGLLETLGMRAYAAETASQAAEMCRVRCVDLVFADVLTGGPQLLLSLRRNYGIVRPGCALTCIGGFPAQDAGFPVLVRPYTQEALAALIGQMLDQALEIDGALALRIDALLTRLGVPETPGRRYLGRAVGMAVCDSRLSSRLSAKLYPRIAAQCGANPAQVERAIRRCIDQAWSRGSINEQYALFGNTIDAQRGKPTIAQMIARCADILRLEEFL